ncbi:MAG: S8 family serine peptidase [Myxococcota bacterium]
MRDMIWLISLAVASEVAFYPGRGDTQITLPDTSLLTGRLIAHIDDVEALRSHPDIAEVQILAGSGHVVSVVPANGVSSVELANALHDDPGVDWAHPDLRLPLVAHRVPNDPLLETQWHLINEGQRGYVPGVDINATEAWDITTGEGMLIAVLDSGTDIDHPDLPVIDGRDYVDNDPSSDPDNRDNHGTAVAGLIASRGDNGIGTAGVAFDAEVYGIRILAEGDGDATTQGIYEAFVEAVDAGAHVVNNSWGSSLGCQGFSIMGALQEAFDYVESEGRDGLGTVNIFAAGNSSCDITNDGILAHPAVFGVAAVTGLDRRANYSNVGPWVDISGPSNNIATTDLVGDGNSNANIGGDPDYTPNFGGTSAAAPQVAGVAALMIAANPRISAAEVRQVLCDTAVRIDIDGGFYNELGWSPLYGCGRVDAGAAVRAVKNLGGPDAPVIPETATTTPDSVVLSWPVPIDPDDDLLQYRVRWAWSTSPKDEFVELLDEPRIDITELNGGVQGEVLWRVRALDPWGPSDWSATQTLTVAIEEETGGCRHGAGYGGASTLGVLLGLGLRRRRES